MRKVYKIIVLGVLLLVTVGVILSVIKLVNASSDKAIFKKPIVSFVTIDNDRLLIDAGNYHYGDVDLNGKINNDDINNIEFIIEDKYLFTDSQKKIADVDSNGTVDENDIVKLRNYIANHKEKYGINRGMIRYCISASDNNSDCKWTRKNEFKFSDKRDYYIFVKNTLTNTISDSYKVSVDDIEYACNFEHDDIDKN